MINDKYSKLIELVLELCKKTIDEKIEILNYLNNKTKELSEECKIIIKKIQGFNERYCKV